jgi:hypothetical protein
MSAKEGRPVKRTCRVWEAGAGHRWVLTLTELPPRAAAVDTHYHLLPVASDRGRAFALAKVAGGGRPGYHVNLAADGPTCDCKGHLAHGRCKHVEALLALQARGQLDRVRGPAARAGGAAGPV